MYILAGFPSELLWFSVDSVLSDGHYQPPLFTRAAVLWTDGQESLPQGTEHLATLQLLEAQDIVRMIV